ncbi:CRISPR-associated protein Cas4 [sulfur-oxidizing endosymbiont of Gigantopelta aegis]|uniref:CRISPR-associated protein Cas4 n=1 Tax=sulfur-oxidizing endosymbiont of Gigantopelta aegis TaxID=2794934 RepID=UPI0018DE1C41|nr:CRISPR-associated protein Cas4 [sulfur-oxidizing endosymbiont of Gigantopelta aegis]
MSDDAQTIMLSALQHYAYCPRQFALIHIEQVWADNYFTAHGNLLHERVDSCEPEQRGNVRYERSVAVKSKHLRITGKLDLLEIEGNPPVRYFPVEYKRGKPKIESWDKIQLCAQALCLEEMRNITIDKGALWYWQVRKREQVSLDDKLRSETIAAIDDAHLILSSGKTPSPTNQTKRCRACSLVDLCEPDTFREDHSKSYINELFEQVRK